MSLKVIELKLSNEQKAGLKEMMNNVVDACYNGNSNKHMAEPYNVVIKNIDEQSPLKLFGGFLNVVQYSLDQNKNNSLDSIVKEINEMIQDEANQPHNEEYDC